jgi:hypothetical protein
MPVLFPGATAAGTLSGKRGQHGVRPVAPAKAIAAALRYDYPGDPSAALVIEAYRDLEGQHV